MSLNLHDYDYPLPKEQIAQQPLPCRTDARLMVIDRQEGQIEHAHVRDLPEWLGPGDRLVLNDTRVVPARVVGYRTKTGGRWQGLFLDCDARGLWRLLAKTRGKFGKRICGHQAVRHSLVDAKTKLAACRHMLYHAAWLADEGRDCSVESSMAKLFIADTGVDIVLSCQRVMGAYGCAEEYDMERYVRDMTLMPIVGGSSNMQKNNIANRLGLPLK